jgi:hypothetical protein
MGGGGGFKRGRRVSLTTSLLFVSRLPRKCWILDVSQPYRPPRFVTSMALLLLDFPHSHAFYNPTYEISLSLMALIRVIPNDEMEYGGF